MQLGMKLVNFVMLPHPELFLCSSSSPSLPFTYLVIATLVTSYVQGSGCHGGDVEHIVSWSADCAEQVGPCPGWRGDRGEGG